MLAANWAWILPIGRATHWLDRVIHQLLVVEEVHAPFAVGLLLLAQEEGGLVDAVHGAVGRDTRLRTDEVGKCAVEVEDGNDLVAHTAGLNVGGPADEGRNPQRPFPG